MTDSSEVYFLKERIKELEQQIALFVGNPRNRKLDDPREQKTSDVLVEAGISHLAVVFVSSQAFVILDFPQDVEKARRLFLENNPGYEYTTQRGTSLYFKQR